MTVINVMTVVLSVITGITFVACATLADERHPDLKKEIWRTIGRRHYGNDARDVQPLSLSDFGVAPRFLNPAGHAVGRARAPRAETRESGGNVIERLRSSVTLRDNVLYVFSYLLHGRESGLTGEQYASLQTLYDVLRRRMVYVYNVFPPATENDGDKNRQTRDLLLALTRNLPPYLRCAAKFLVDEIELGRLDLNALLRPTAAAETFDYLANVEPGAISTVKHLGEEEMQGYDGYSNVTQRALGPVFVKLLHDLRANDLPLTQELFGLMLMNLPNPGDDPVLEENVRYLYDVTQSGLVANWDPIGRSTIGRDAYTVVLSALSRIVVDPTAGYAVRNAAAYVRDHLRPVTPNHANPYLKYVRDLTERNVDMATLLAAAVPREFGADAVRVRDRLLTHFARNYGNGGDLDRILKGFNRFAYRDPLDLLMALLTRISNRMPTTASGADVQSDVLRPFAALLSALIVKMRPLTAYVPSEIDVPTLLDPELNPTLSPAVDAVKFELIARPRVSVLLSTLIPTEKSEECLTPGQCLTNALRRIRRLREDGVPAALTTKIRSALRMLKPIALTRYQPWDFRYSVIPADVGLYDDNADRPIVVVIEADGGAPPDSPNGLSGPYLWSIDKYISASPAVPDESPPGTSEWPRTPALINSAGAGGEISSTTVVDQARITEHAPSRLYGHATDRWSSSTLKPSLTTPSSHITSQISHGTPALDNESTSIPTSNYDKSPRSTQKSPWQRLPQKESKRPRTAQPPYGATVPSNDTEGHYGSEVEYPRAPETIPDETRGQNRPDDENDESVTRRSDRVSRRKSVSPHVAKPHGMSPKGIRETQEKGRPATSLRPSPRVSATPTTLKHPPPPPAQPEKSPENARRDSASLESLDSPEMTGEEDVTRSVNRRDEARDAPAISRPVEENESVASAIVFPPSVEPDHPLTIELSDNGVPVVTTDERRNATTSAALVLPAIKELLKSPNVDGLLEELDAPIVAQVLRPLSVILGKNYIRRLVRDADPKLYPTNIALLLAVLERAKNDPEVANNRELAGLIRKYIASIEYVSPTVLLPVVISSKKLVSDTVYSTFDPRDPSRSEISESPPDGNPPGIVTVPLANPKMWLRSIDPREPYADLLPPPQRGGAFETILRPLRQTLTMEKIARILGTDFRPQVYPNKGALLITLLRKLRDARTVRSNVALRTAIEMYIRAIEAPSMNIHVSEDRFVKMMSETTGHWQAELTSLIYALPSAKRDAEIAMMEAIKRFLADPDLLEKLQIARPSLTMSRGELLRVIIRTALANEALLTKETLRALRYYRDRVKLNDIGALPVVRVWVQVYVVKAEVKLGDMIEKMVDFDKLAYEEKLAYNDLVTYLAENPRLLQDNEDFEFEKYKTQGEFVKALFEYLLRKQRVSGTIKQYIRMLLPRVTLTGPGAIAMPSFSESP